MEGENGWEREECFFLLCTLNFLLRQGAVLNCSSRHRQGYVTAKRDAPEGSLASGSGGGMTRPGGARAQACAANLRDWRRTR